MTVYRVLFFLNCCSFKTKWLMQCFLIRKEKWKGGFRCSSVYFMYHLHVTSTPYGTNGAKLFKIYFMLISTKQLTFWCRLPIYNYFLERDCLNWPDSNNTKLVILMPHIKSRGVYQVTHNLLRHDRTGYWTKCHQFYFMFSDRSKIIERRF